MRAPETKAYTPPEASNAPMVLVVLTGSSRGATYEITHETGTITLGKATTGDVVLNDDTVSRKHCTIERVGSELRVHDLQSTNGTRVAGVRVSDAVIPPGVILRLGDVELAIRYNLRDSSAIVPSEHAKFGAVVGASIVMRTLFAVLDRVAPSDATVLFLGESGTGKDVLARALVEAGPRKAKPFVVVDCGAVSAPLIESELFGHERGAFTGAATLRKGAFEVAAGGTLFLDEVGELPIELQPKLLRVLEAREFRRVGGNTVFKTDVRIVAATTRDLEREVRAGKFREDLYFRLAVLPLTVPPLRERRSDIPLIARALLANSKGPAVTLSDADLAELSMHDWPGNVRELRNVLERASVTQSLGLGSSTALRSESEAFVFHDDEAYRDAKSRYERAFEQAYLRWLRGLYGDNVSQAARAARMDRKHLSELLKKHNFHRE